MTDLKEYPSLTHIQSNEKEKEIFPAVFPASRCQHGQVDLKGRK